jgi:hypothetical protein
MLPSMLMGWESAERNMSDNLDWDGADLADTNHAAVSEDVVRMEGRRGWINGNVSSRMD